MKCSELRPARPRSLRAFVLAMLAALGVLVASASPAAAQTQQQWVYATLGQPDHLGYAVSDVAAVRRQLAAATGNEFTAPSTSVVLAWLPGEGPKLMTHTVSRTVRGGPTVELIQSSSKIGPWASSSSSSPFFYSYSVDNLVLASLQLRGAGFELIAADIGTFAYFRGKGGVTIRLVDKRFAANGGTTHRAQAPIDFGPASGATIIPCVDPLAVKDQLSSALTGLSWRPEMAFPLEYMFDDGTRTVLNMSIHASQAQPFVVVETPLHAPETHGCTATSPHAHVMWLTNDVPAAAAQLESAGMQWVSRVPGLSSHHKGVGGIYVEAASAAFLGG